MNISIVVLNYNDTYTTIRYLNAILGFRILNSIIVVDNASTDTDTEELKHFCKDNEVVFLASDMNRGYSSGNNIGVRYAIGQCNAEVVFISNPDIICSEEAISNICKQMEKLPDAGIITGLIHVKDPNNGIKVYSSFAYKVPKKKDMMLNCLPVITKLRKDVLKTSMYFDPSLVVDKGILKVGVVSGCFFAINANAYCRISGFDEDTFLYNEEPIIGYRLEKAGYSTYVINETIIHDEKQDKNRGFRRQWKWYLLNRSSATVYLKKYLRFNSFEMSLYYILGFVGFIENYIIQQLRILLTRR